MPDPSGVTLWRCGSSSRDTTSPQTPGSSWIPIMWDWRQWEPGIHGGICRIMGQFWVASGWGLTQGRCERPLEGAAMGKGDKQ